MCTSLVLNILAFTLFDQMDETLKCFDPVDIHLFGV